MADSPLTVPRDAQGNIPKWVLVGGGIVAIVALYSFAKNKQTGVGGSTVAAGTSINAALGSLQEEVLNAQGTASSETAAALQNLSNQNTVINTHITDVGSGLQNQILSGEAITYQGRTIAEAGPMDPRVNQWGQQATGYAEAANASLNDQSAAHLASAATGTF